VDHLTANLLDLLFELEGRGIPVMIGGGYGLFLKRRHLAATRERTLFEKLPEARVTNDLDLFLRAELLSDLDRTREVKEAILRLGYVPVERKFARVCEQFEAACGLSPKGPAPQLEGMAAVKPVFWI